MRRTILMGIFALLLFGTWVYAPHDAKMSAEASPGATIPGTIPPASAIDFDVAAPDQNYGPGDTVVFELSLTNIFTQTLTDVYIEVTVPPYSTFDASSSNADWQQVVAGTVGGASGAPCPDGGPAGTSCTYYIPTLTPGALPPVDFAVQLAEDIPRTTSSLALEATVNAGELITSLPDTVTSVKIFDLILIPTILFP